LGEIKAGSSGPDSLLIPYPDKFILGSILQEDKVISVGIGGIQPIMAQLPAILAGFAGDVNGQDSVPPVGSRIDLPGAGTVSAKAVLLGLGLVDPVRVVENTPGALFEFFSSRQLLPINICLPPAV